jgi:transposase
MIQAHPSSTGDLWARFRFSVAGSLLSSPPARGALQAAIDCLAQKTWSHPVTGRYVRFAAVTIARWYYAARHEHDDPVGALRRAVRKDRGKVSMAVALAERLILQHRDYPHWSYQLHYDNLAALVKADPSLGLLRSYSTVRRYMEAHGLVRKQRLQLKGSRGEARVHEHDSRDGCAQGANEEQSREWMLRVLQGKEAAPELKHPLKMPGDLELLLDVVRSGGLRDRNKALTILAEHRGISIPVITHFLFVSTTTVVRYCRVYRTYGCVRLLRGFRERRKKSDDQVLQNSLFAILHAPPITYDINRTTWKMADLKRVLEEQGQKASSQVIREIIKSAGYTWRKARVVLTSNDPEYREKLAKIQSVLSTLGPNERFFSIDEFGRFAVKIQGGRSLAPPGKVRTVPQRQKSKGSLIVTAALELSTNQLTHFYSDKKNTAEMIRLLEVLLDQYKGIGKMYFSWDTASWHASKALYERVEKINSPEYRSKQGTACVELVPLPSCAQFLNVIESVFSGMAKAVIHNSDYDSVGACKVAVDRHFAERNAYFAANPKRAGRKIWGQEIAPSEFSESNNCKNQRYSFLGL